MSHPVRMLLVLAVTAGMLHCRTTRQTDANAPQGDNVRGPGEVGDWSSGETGATDATRPNPPPTAVGWGPPGTKFKACPNALCAAQAPAGLEEIRGCEAGHVEPPPPAPVQIDSGERGGCEEDYGMRSSGAMGGSYGRGVRSIRCWRR